MVISVFVLLKLLSFTAELHESMQAAIPKVVALVKVYMNGNEDGPAAIKASSSLAEHGALEW